MKVTLVKGDITKQYVDAIVCPSDNMLSKVEGVNASIHAAAGPELFEACMKLGGCRPGDAKITDGYNLPADYVIHTAAPIWRGGSIGEEDQLTSCYTSCMELAIEKELESIAFPLISVGANGFPKRGALAVAILTLLQYEEDDIEISLVFGNSDTYMLANRLLTQLSKK